MILNCWGNFLALSDYIGVVVEEEGGGVKDRGGESSTKFKSLN